MCGTLYTVSSQLCFALPRLTAEVPRWGQACCTGPGARPTAAAPPGNARPPATAYGTGRRPGSAGTCSLTLARPQLPLVFGTAVNWSCCGARWRTTCSCGRAAGARRLPDQRLPRLRRARAPDPDRPQSTGGWPPYQGTAGRRRVMGRVHLAPLPCSLPQPPVPLRPVAGFPGRPGGPLPPRLLWALCGPGARAR
jgi:hypothetical protein